MTIGSEKKTEIQPDPGSNYLDALFRQLSPEQREDFLNRHSGEETLPAVIEDKPENKIAHLNYQEFGLNDLEWRFVQEYFANGYNASRAYLTANPTVKPDTARQMGPRFIRKPHIHRFVNACFNAIGMTNAELERRLEVLSTVDLLDAYDIDEKTGEIIRFNALKAKQSGVSMLITSIKVGKNGKYEVTTEPRSRLIDIHTKVRGMQKQVSITADVHKIAEGNDRSADEVKEILEVLKEVAKEEIIARTPDGVTIYASD